MTRQPLIWQRQQAKIWLVNSHIKAHETNGMRRSMDEFKHSK